MLRKLLLSAALAGLLAGCSSFHMPSLSWVPFFGGDERSSGPITTNDVTKIAKTHKGLPADTKNVHHSAETPRGDKDDTP